MTPFHTWGARYVSGLSFGGDLSGPIPEPRYLQERRQGGRVTASLSRQQVDLPPDRVAFKWDSLDKLRAVATPYAESPVCTIRNQKPVMLMIRTNVLKIVKLVVGWS